MKIKVLFVLAAIGLVGASWLWGHSLAMAQTTTAPVLQILTPGGGEQWNLGSSQSFIWYSPTSSSSTLLSLSLVPYCATNCPAATTTVYTVATSVPNNGIYTWMAGSTAGSGTVPAGQYTLTFANASSGSVLATSSPFTLTGPQAAGATSTALSIISLTPTSGPVGTVVTVSGSGFSSSTSVQFGPGYISGAVSSATAGTVLQFAIPSSINPCAPWSTGACPYFAALLTPGTYQVSLAAASGTSNSLPFTITSPGTGTGTIPGSTASTSPLISGSLVQVGGNPTVYLVRNNVLVPFTSAQIFLARGYQWSQIQMISQSQLNSQSISPMYMTAPDGSLIRGSGETVYLVTNSGRKSAIPNATVLARVSPTQTNITFVSDQDLLLYPDTSPQQ